MNRPICIYIFFLLLSSCQNDDPNINVLNQNDDLEHRVSFQNIGSEDSGIDFINKSEIKRQDQGAGVALADFDNDGLIDIFFCGNKSSNAIYRNKGAFKFDNKSTGLPKSNRWSVGATVVDINNDGLFDIYVCNTGKSLEGNVLANELYVNNGDFTFTEKASEYGLDISSYSIQAGFFDIDNDGDQDLWINNHADPNVVDEVLTNADIKENKLLSLNLIQDERIARSKLILLKNEKGKFVDISVQAQVNTAAFARGLSIADLNEDGFLDVYVANDHWIPDFYFVNRGNGTFVFGTEWIKHMPYGSKGCDVADINNDGKIDFIVVENAEESFYEALKKPSKAIDNFHELVDRDKFPRQYNANSLHMAIGSGVFSETARLLGIDRSDWSWAPLIFDMDNDGNKDIFISNGKLDGKRLNNSFYINNGGRFKKRDVVEGVNTGISIGAAYGDLDNDGRLDLVISRVGEEALVLKNTSVNYNYVKIRFEAKNPSRTKNAVVNLYAQDLILRLDNEYVRGYCSHVGPDLIFGLGRLTNIDSIVVKWIGNFETVLKDVKVNELNVINYDEIKGIPILPQGINRDFLEASAMLQKLGAVHKEGSFNDFESEPLLPYKFSALGPALATGDVDGDGREDIYLGGSLGNIGGIYMMEEGVFSKNETQGFDNDKKYEDLGAEFVDVDGDGDLDLYVASGGGAEIKNNASLQDRLYLNNGEGDFTMAKSALPKITTSTKAVVPLDFDKDGDIDFFIGGRNVVGKYAQKASSYLLFNENGRFKNMIDESFQSQLPLMVTDAITTDINSDQFPDIIAVGEWSAPIAFKNNGGRGFEKIDMPGFTDLNGWWQSIEKGDFNGDGKDDFILGNFGLNSEFGASQHSPLSLLKNDFDKDGDLDYIIVRKINNEVVTIHRQEDLIKAMPNLVEKFKNSGQSTLANIIGVEKIDSAEELQVNRLESVILLSKDGGYNVQTLPMDAQRSAIMDIEIIDIDEDGNLDAFVAGNIYNMTPVISSLDAGDGLVLYGNGDGDFKCSTDITKSGVVIRGDCKNLAIVRRPNNDFAIVAANNNGMLQILIRP